MAAHALHLRKPVNMSLETPALKYAVPKEQISVNFATKGPASMSNSKNKQNTATPKLAQAAEIHTCVCQRIIASRIAKFIAKVHDAQTAKRRKPINKHEQKWDGAAFGLVRFAALRLTGVTISSPCSPGLPMVWAETRFFPPVRSAPALFARCVKVAIIFFVGYLF